MSHGESCTAQIHMASMGHRLDRIRIRYEAGPAGFQNTLGGQLAAGSQQKCLGMSRRSTGSPASIVPKTERHVNLGLYKYISSEDRAWHIIHHSANVVVLVNWLWDLKPRYRQLLGQSGYVMVDKVGEAEIYRWNRAGR